MQLLGCNSLDSSNSLIVKHFGESPFPAYEPVFDWENERSMIFGQRNPKTHLPQYAKSYAVASKYWTKDYCESSVTIVSSYTCWAVTHALGSYGLDISTTKRMMGFSIVARDHTG